jgi:WD40 repeat protein
MKRSHQLLACVAGLALSSSAIAQEKPAEKGIEPMAVNLGRPVSYEQDIRDIFDFNCVACHNVGTPESKLNLESVDQMIKGGKRGAGIVPGKPDESLLYLVAARKKAPHMPPLPNKVEAKAFSPKELGLLRQWIIEGAKTSGDATGANVNWQPIPKGMKASYAVAMSPWGERVAASRANQINVINLATGDEAKLIDPALNAVQFNGQPMYPNGAAERDFVHSLTMHPNGRMIASGGFRVVKLWEQPANVQTAKMALGAVPAAAVVHPPKALAAFATKQNVVVIHSLANGQQVKKLEGHTAGVNGIAFSADGNQVVSGSDDKTVRIWQLDNGQVVRQFETPSPIKSLCLSGDGKQIVTGHEDAKIRVWNVAAGEAGKPEVVVKEIPGHGGPVTALTPMLPAGPQVVSGSTDGTARVWDITSGAAVKTFGHGAPVTSVAARPDGKAIASGSANNSAKLWKFENQQMVAELRGHLPTKRAEALSNEDFELSKQLVTLASNAEKASDASVKERTEALKKAMEAKDKAEKDIVEAKKKFDEAKAKADAAKTAADNAKDNKDLQTANDNAQKELQKQTDELKKNEEAQKSAIRGLELATETEKKAQEELKQTQAAHLAAQAEQKVKEENFKKAQEATKAADKPVVAVSFSADSKRLATAGEDNTIHIWDAELGQVVDTLVGSAAPVRVLAFVNNKQLLSAGDDQQAIVWDANPEWKLAATLGASKENPLDISKSPFIFRVLSLAFSPDGKTLVTGGGEPSRSGELYVWDVEKREIIKKLPDAHSDTVFDIEFSRDGKKILTGAADKFVKIHDVTTGQFIKAFEGHTHHVLGVSWKADGSELVSAGADNAVKVWNVTTGEQIRTVPGYQKQVTSIRYMGVSGNTVSCGGDATVRFITANNGSNFRNFAGSTGYMYAADASRDEKVVVAAGEDGVIRVWNGTNAQVIRTFDPPAAETAQASVAK